MLFSIQQKFNNNFDNLKLKDYNSYKIEGEIQ